MEDDLKKKWKTTSKINKNLFWIPLKFQGNPFLGLAQLSKIFLILISIFKGGVLNFTILLPSLHFFFGTLVFCFGPNRSFFFDLDFDQDEHIIFINQYAINQYNINCTHSHQTSKVILTAIIKIAGLHMQNIYQHIKQCALHIQQWSNSIHTPVCLSVCLMLDVCPLFCVTQYNSATPA